MSNLTKEESEYLRSKLRRYPNKVETEIVGAEWSEHCSYKSSKRFIRTFPHKGDRIVLGPGNDAGILDVGDGYVVTVHIESKPPFCGGSVWWCCNWSRRGDTRYTFNGKPSDSTPECS